MKKNKPSIKECFWYLHGKCARDLENAFAKIPCKKKCEFFELYRNFFNGMKEEDYD